MVAAGRRPLLLVVDDLHRANAPSLAMPRFVGRELQHAGPLVLSTYRHVEVDRGHPLLASLADLTRAGSPAAAAVARPTGHR
jgi:predicted ATPase